MNIAPTFGLDPVSLDRAAAANAKRMVAAGEAKKLRDEFFKLKAWADGNAWTACQRIFPEERTVFEELDVIRENWVEALWGMNRRVCE